MSIYLKIEDGEPRQIATNRGWGDFCRWTQKLRTADYTEPKRLAVYGCSVAPAALEAQLRTAMDARLPHSVPGLPTTIEGILTILTERPPDAEIITVTDGLPK